ncbi:Fur family transcriptional regulator [Novosphingobium mangrovi (ex Huang et al. 2023)]|uniref:Transcriptional repressor n=1 Tax=Novosphingobium mangrovi (ex Huang et al. 2023) TaxID=2976432 RepID=A0ABT2I507_9SPHN|nr:transcriptional repressor [Novosphingobium mangrovi (ex Huang et al. 2023)]MCT2399902.1 transcriptional repressor [Novosphingobium mangrovi (ex Huang et al. 2023)]
MEPDVASASVGRRRCSAENDALVLDLLTQANRPLSAYDIADRLGGRGTHMVANQVYRTLARLIDRHRVLRIETLNAYVLRRSGANICLICKCCGAIAWVDLPCIDHVIGKAAQGRCFDLTDAPIEARGECDECRSAD